MVARAYHQGTQARHTAPSTPISLSCRRTMAVISFLVSDGGYQSSITRTSTESPRAAAPVSPWPGVPKVARMQCGVAVTHGSTISAPPGHGTLQHPRPRRRRSKAGECIIDSSRRSSVGSPNPRVKSDSYLGRSPVYRVRSSCPGRSDWNPKPRRDETTNVYIIINGHIKHI
jgi:hypothetical protein